MPIPALPKHNVRNHCGKNPGPVSEADSLDHERPCSITHSALILLYLRWSARMIPAPGITISRLVVELILRLQCLRLPGFTIGLIGLRITSIGPGQFLMVCGVHWVEPNRSLQVADCGL